MIAVVWLFECLLCFASYNLSVILMMMNQKEVVVSVCVPDVSLKLETHFSL